MSAEHRPRRASADLREDARLQFLGLVKHLFQSSPRKGRPDISSARCRRVDHPGGTGDAFVGAALGESPNDADARGAVRPKPAQSRQAAATGGRTRAWDTFPRENGECTRTVWCGRRPRFSQRSARAQQALSSWRQVCVGREADSGGNPSVRVINNGDCVAPFGTPVSEQSSNPG